MEEDGRTSEIDPTWVRPKIWRTTREARDATDEPDSSDRPASDRPASPDAPDRTGRPAAEDRGGSDDHGGARSKPHDPAGDPRHLRTVGPFVSHFSGRVVQVFGTTQRPRPSTTPLRSAAFLFFVAITLPYAVGLLPVLVLLFVAWLWLRRCGWLRGGLRLPRFSNRSVSDPGLLMTSFRVRLSRDDGETEAAREIDCRLVQRADLGPAPLVGGERVTGRGHRTARGVVEVSRVRMHDSGTTLRTTSPKSRISVLVPASLLVTAGAAVLYVQCDQIPPVDIDATLSVMALVLGCLLLSHLIKITLRRMF